MVDYIKDAWKISGRLDKSKYFTAPNIIWTIFVVIFLVFNIGPLLKECLSPNIINTIIQFLELLLCLAILAAVWLINVRFSPFSFKGFNISAQKIIADSLQQYNNVKNAGPRIFEERPDSTTSADKIIKAPLFGNGNWTIINNEPVQRQESTFSHYSNAVKSGIETGMIGFAQKAAGWLFKVMLWPVSFISGLLNMGPIVHQYHKVQEKQQASMAANSDNLNNQF